MNRELLQSCTLCPRRCGVNRAEGEIGFCGAKLLPKIARAALHFWEEPCLSGKNGSGTVFFSHCTMQCVYCQNFDISTCQKGKEISIDALSGHFLRLQSEGAHNINLVTPTHFVPQIIDALTAARQNGLSIPVVYNSSGYESVDTLCLLDGLIDIYLPDFKYYHEKYAIRYSGAPDYFETASQAIHEMVRQSGPPEFDENGIMQKGTIVRHLMLPGLLFDSKKIIDYLYEAFGDAIYISIMSQYTPLPHVCAYPELDRRVPPAHYAALVDYAASLGITQAYVQEGESAKESFIPPFCEKDSL